MEQQKETYISFSKADTDRLHFHICLWVDGCYEDKRIEYAEIYYDGEKVDVVDRLDIPEKEGSILLGTITREDWRKEKYAGIKWNMKVEIAEEEKKEEEMKVQDIEFDPFAEELESLEIPAKQKIVLSEEQQGVIDRIGSWLDPVADSYCNEEGRFMFLTGKAGAGKSVVVREIVENYRSVVMAPTGLAAMHVGGATIHSVFNFPAMPLTRFSAKGLRPEMAAALRMASVILIDEVSMVRADVMDAIDKSLRICCNNENPFGGKVVVGVGDLWQIEPVVTKDDKEEIEKKYPSPFFFDAKVFSRDDGCEIQYEQLSKSFRQQNDAEFLENLDKLRVGDKTVCKYFNQRVNQRVENPIQICMTNETARSFNRRMLSSLDTEERTYSATGKFLEKVKDSEAPTEKELRLKVGAKVLFIKNTDWFVNGEVGVIESLHDNHIMVRKGEEGEGLTVPVSPATWEKTSYEADNEEKEFKQTVEAEFTQLPIKLGWAITSHKSQGQTYDAIQVNRGKGAFAHGQIYVALSRAKRFESISLVHPLSPNDIKVSQQVVNFFKFMENTL